MCKYHDFTVDVLVMMYLYKVSCSQFPRQRAVLCSEKSMRKLKRKVEAIRSTSASELQQLEEFVHHCLSFQDTVIVRNRMPYMWVKMKKGQLKFIFIYKHFDE